jgi:hypothetical protein
VFIILSWFGTIFNVIEFALRGILMNTMHSDIYCITLELDDENWRPTYILPEDVDHSKTIRKFINVFKAEVQKLEGD